MSIDERPTSFAQTINILLVDDSKEDQLTLSRALSKTNLHYSLKIIDQPDNVLTSEYIDELNGFDIIFLDYNFPTGVASNYLHLLKKHWDLKIPIVLLTGVEAEILKNNIEAYDNVQYKVKNEETYASLGNLLKTTLSR